MLILRAHFAHSMRGGCNSFWRLRCPCKLWAERAWYEHGHALERFAQMTDWNFLKDECFFEAFLRFQRGLRRVGLWAGLEKGGV
jgi:hypothetical protein